MRKLIRASILLIPWWVRGWIRRIPLIAPMQRWVLARYIEGCEFIHTVDAGPACGLKYPVTLPQDKSIWTGTYEVNLAALVSKTVHKGDICFDVGGWRGYFGGVMALAGAKRVYVFEPLPENVTQLRKMIALNSHLPITIIEAAAAERSGDLRFAVMPESSMGKLTVSAFDSCNQSGKEISVRAVSLDDLLASGEVKPPAIIKMDVEGSELLVLKGAREMLMHYRPKLIIEVHSSDLGRDCRTFLEDLGYDIRVILDPGREICHYFADARRNG